MKKMLFVISLAAVLSSCATGQRTVSAYHWTGDPDESHGIGDLKTAAAQCEWEIRKTTIARPSAAPQYYPGYGGYNDPQMGMAAANIAAIAASMPPGPAVLDECLAAKGWRLVDRH